MRIERLDLTFGCFDGYELPLAGDGVHLVVGPNEAGKSTVRHAISQFLYGIDIRTTYDFAVGSKSDLWIGARLRFADGTVLEAKRHKRAKDPLTDPDGTPIDPAQLAQLLRGVSAAEFAQTFAVDHDELVSGGDALFNGKGDLEHALFETKSGLRLERVLKQLNERMDRIYKARAQLPTLNAALARYGEARDRVKRVTLRVDRYEQQKTMVDTADKQWQRLEEEVRRQRLEVSQLSRIQQSVPGLANHARLSAERDALCAAGPMVAAGTGEALDALRVRLRDAQESGSRAESRQERISAQLVELVLDLAVLDHAAEIDRLHAEAVAVAEAERRAADLRAEAERARAAAAGLGQGSELSEVPPGLAERIEELRRGKTELDAALNSAEQQVARRARARDDAAAVVAEVVGDAEAPSAEAVRELKTLIKAVPGGLAEEVVRLRKDVAAVETKMLRVLRQHGLREGAHELPVPSVGQVAAHRAAVDELDAGLARLRERLAEVTEAVEMRQRDLEVLLRTDPPPTENDLVVARERRSASWARLRGVLLDPAAEPGLAGSVDVQIEEHEDAVAHADEVVDRIRREAEQSARRLRLEVDIDADRKQIERLHAEQESGELRRLGLRADWERLWQASGIAAPDMEAAAELLGGITEVRELADDLDRSRAELAEAAGRADRLAERLRPYATAGSAAGADVAGSAVDAESAGSALVVPDPAAPSSTAATTDLAELLARAEDRLADLEAAHRDHDQRLERLARAEEELEAADLTLGEARERLGEWRGEWTELVRTHHLEGEPGAVLALLTELAESTRLHRLAADAEREAEAAERRVADFIAALETARGVPDPADPYAEAQALHRLLEEQRTIQTKRGELTAELTRTEDEIADARHDREAAERGISELVGVCGVANLEALQSAIARTAAVADLVAKLEAVEETLRGTGLSLAALQGEAAEWEGDPDALLAALEAAKTNLGALESERDDQLRTLTELQKDLRAMDGSAQAAEASELASGELATVVAESEEYLRLFMARRILQDCMEEYRAANQGPVLARAEEMFGVLTGGGFPRLVTDADDKGRVLLYAQRATGERVDIEAMSEGTRDQLYLALRLASLDRHADAGRPMPLLLDDVFMTFDDRRSAAGLRVLDRIADRFQVIVFTHHPHLAEVARTALPAERVHVHQLPDRAATASVPAQSDAFGENVDRETSAAP